MSDLSRLLDDLYHDDTPDRAPSWSSDEALDEAFAAWVPGPGVDASPTERAIVAGATFEQMFEPVITLDDMALTSPVVVDRPCWSPSDDDILPGRRKRRR